MLKTRFDWVQTISEDQKTEAIVRKWTNEKTFIVLAWDRLELSLSLLKQQFRESKSQVDKAFEIVLQKFWIKTASIFSIANFTFGDTMAIVKMAKGLNDSKQNDWKKKRLTDRLTTPEMTKDWNY